MSRHSDPLIIATLVERRLDDLQSVGIGFVTLGEGIDTTTPTGRLRLHVLSAIGQFERDRIAERVNAGLQRARKQGHRIGRPRRRLDTVDLARTAHLSIGDARSILHRARVTLSAEPPH
jgi:DNA invertase Pin-like site-specific DNA recombinase